MKNLTELRQKRGVAVTEARKILDKAETEKRELTAEDRAQYDKLYAEQERLKGEIELEERQAELEREMRAVPPSETPTRPEPEDRSKKPEDRKRPRETEEYRASFRRYLATGRVDEILETRNLSPEERDLQADSDVAGGFVLAPQQFVADFIKAVDDQVFIKGLATVAQLAGSGSIGRPSLDADPADADWTSELATGSADTAMAFGKRELHPHPLAKRLKISRKLIRLGGGGFESFAQSRLAYKFAITEEKAFITGNGAAQPLGLFTASADGISTGRDVSAGNTTTTIGADNLFENKFKLKSNYWPSARWLFHRDAMKQISQLKDGNGQYLWQPGLQSGQPERILGFPVLMSEYVPNTFTTGLYVGLLGDFSNYWIGVSLDMEVMRLVELYAESNQIGLIGRMEIDGMPVLEEAFSRVKLA